MTMQLQGWDAVSARGNFHVEKPIPGLASELSKQRASQRTILQTEGESSFQDLDHGPGKQAKDALALVACLRLMGQGPESGGSSTLL